MGFHSIGHVFIITLILIIVFLFANPISPTGFVLADQSISTTYIQGQSNSSPPEQIFSIFPINPPINPYPELQNHSINQSVSQSFTMKEGQRSISPTISQPSLLPDMNLDLKSGWNFISIPKPLISGRNTVSIFNLVPMSGHSLFSYQPQGGWKRSLISDIIQPMAGYWIYAATPYQVPLFFEKNSSLNGISLHLQKGWNAVGTGKMEIATVNSTFESMKASWLFLIPFNISTQTNDIAIIKGWNGSGGEGYELQPGIGYWIYMITDGDFITSKPIPLDSLVNGKVDYLVEDQGWTITLPGTVTGYMSQQTGEIRLSSRDAVISYAGKKYPIMMNINARLADNA